jgi:integrase
MGKFHIHCKLTERTAAAARPTQARTKSDHPCAMLYHDTTCPGFALAVQPTGAKRYYVLRRVHGKQVKHRFADYDQITLQQARKQAAKLLAQMLDGVNPAEQRRRERAEAARAKVRGITLRQAMEQAESELRKGEETSARTLDDRRYLLETYLKDWLDRELATITRKDVRERHDKIPLEIARGKHNEGKPRGEGAGKLTANHVMRAFRAVYNHATIENEELPANPIRPGFTWYKERRRTSRIPEAGLKDWYASVQALNDKKSVLRDYLLFTLFTGLRRTNAAEVRWEDVDWDRRALHVPKPKSQRPFDLPLSDFLLDLLRRRQEENKKLAPDSPWVFPAAHGGGHIVEVRMAGGAERAKGTAPDKYRPHDLRRTFVSVATNLKVPRSRVMLLVNHATPKADVHGGYDNPTLDELHVHMREITDKLRALCEPPPSATVLPMRKRAKATR